MEQTTNETAKFWPIKIDFTNDVTSTRTRESMLKYKKYVNANVYVYLHVPAHVPVTDVNRFLFNTYVYVYLQVHVDLRVSLLNISINSLCSTCNHSSYLEIPIVHVYSWYNQVGHGVWLLFNTSKSVLQLYHDKNN